MTTQITLELAAASYLVVSPFYVTTRGTFDTTLFRVYPTLIGIGMACMTFGHIMGWPV